MIRKLAAMITIATALLATGANAQTNSAWTKDKVTAKGKQVAQSLSTYSPRLEGGLKPNGVKSSWRLNESVQRDNNLGTWKEPNWQGTIPVDAATVLCESSDCSRFTIILAARGEFTSQCTKKGQKVGMTFIQIVAGSVSGKEGFEWAIQTVPLPGPVPIGDIAQNEVERFNSWSLYRDIFRLKIETQFPKIAEAAKRYEAKLGANAWIEPGIAGADAPLPPRNCGEVSLPANAVGKTNQ